MSDTINSSDNASESESAKSLGVKILSVVGLALFSGFYFNSWQRSLAKHAEKQQEETAPTESVSAINTVSEETTPTESVSAINTVSEATAPTESVSEVNTVSEETAPIVTEETNTVPETQTTPKITDSNTLETLTSALYNQIDGNWKQYPTFSENLVYRVTMNSAGNIAQYQHINQAASQYIAETPLPQLINSSTADAEDASQATAEFLVVLTPDGKLQVNQWVSEEGVGE